MPHTSGEITLAAGELFRQFDVVSDVSDHHYAGKQPKPTSSTSLSGPTQKKIMQEWKLLSKDLPESIYVRVYETRVDLLRAAIVGAPGTPYHDGLFFFDISFPLDYPVRPPNVYYRSFGYRVNPNLYSNGRVCLSLLNTWTGKKSEKWDPSNSTILQVLLSIQALVLNERPYFNEPGYSTWSGKTYWEKKSLAYSEDVFILSCKTMQWVLTRPPKNFESFVNQHFRDRAMSILSAVDMYRKELVKVGLFDGLVKEGKGEVSSRFKGALDQMFGDLVCSLANTGAPVAHFVQLVRDERERKVKEKAVAAAAVAAKKGKSGEVGKCLVKKLRKIFVGLVIQKNNQNSKTNQVLDVPQAA